MKIPGVAMSRLASVVKVPKQFTFVVVISVVCSVGSVYALERGGPGEAWPKSWPEELERLRKQAWTWVGGLAMNRKYEITFANREELLPTSGGDL